MTAIKQSVALAALLAGLAGGASAQVTYSGSATLGYAMGEGSGELSSAPDMDALTADLAASLSFGNGFGLDLGIGLGNLDIDGSSEDLDVSYVSAAPKFDFGNGFTAGAYIEQGKVEMYGDDIKMLSYGLTGDYAIAGAVVSAYYGKSETDPDLTSDYDIYDYGLGATYMVNPDFKVAGGWSRSRISAFGTDIDLDVWKIGAAYSVTDAFTVFGGGLFGSVEDADIRVYGIGVSYDLSTVAPLPLIASIEYSTDELELSGDTGGYDVWRFGVTIPFGDKTGPVVPLNSVTGAVFDPKANVITDGILAAF